MCETELQAAPTFTGNTAPTDVTLSWSCSQGWAATLGETRTGLVPPLFLNMVEGDIDLLHSLRLLFLRASNGIYGRGG